MKKIVAIIVILLFSKNISYSQTVYICTGQFAEVYHDKVNCTGLNNCKGDVIRVYESDAIYKYNLKRPCCICRFPKPLGCEVDDFPQNNQVTKFNPYIPQGSSNTSSNSASAAAGYAAAGALAFSAIANSNDFYIQYITTNQEFNYQHNNTSSNNGLAFGFRVVNRRTAFEYGASFIPDNYINVDNRNYRNTYYSPPSDSENKKQKWGAHFNYLYNIRLIKNTDKLNMYLGATLNSFFSKEESIGIGAIGGLNIKFFNWLKFDTRFERTNTTNRIATGLQLTFHKN